MPTFEQLLQKIVEATHKHARTATVGQISIGQSAHKAIRLRVGKLLDSKTRRTVRAEVLETISGRLAAEGCPKVNLNRAIAIAGVAGVFGIDDTKKLPVHVVVGFAKLIRRDPAKEEWEAKKKHEDKARELFAKVVSGEIGPGLVRHEINKLVGITPRPPRAKLSPVDRLAAALTKASADELTGALRFLQTEEPDEFRKILRVLKPLAPAKPKAQPEPPPVEPTIEERKRFFGKRGEAA